MMDSQHVKPLPVYPRVCAMETNVIPYKASLESKYPPSMYFLSAYGPWPCHMYFRSIDALLFRVNRDP